MAWRVRKSSGDVFRDLGFDAVEAESLRLRSELIVRVRDAIEQRGWTQKEAARHLGVSQPRISDLVRGKIGRFSMDALVAMLTRAGVDLEIGPARQPRVA